MAMNPDSSGFLKILVVRSDRIGDVVLSTPVLDVIKRHYPRSHLSVMVREQVRPLLAGLPSVDEVFVYEPAGRHAGPRGFLTLVGELRRARFRIAVVLQSQWKIALALFLARVRYRIGPLSKPHSFLFYNRGVRQRRSHVEMHEADYNLQLLRKLGMRVGARNVPVSVHLPEEIRRKAFLWLTSRGWTDESPLIVVHPGMGGSALNWPETHYIELIRALARDGKRIVVTAGPTEVALQERIRQALGTLKERVIFFGPQAEGSLIEAGLDVNSLETLCGIFSWAAVVVAPSTGPLHLAVALKAPVVTFYPPVRVQSAVRWGPYLRDESRASVLVPEVYCGEEFCCRGSLCNYFPCMKGLTVTQALEAVNLQLGRHPAPTSAATPPAGKLETREDLVRG